MKQTTVKEGRDKLISSKVFTLSLPWDPDHQTSYKFLPKRWLSGSQSVLGGQLIPLLEAGSFWESTLIFKHLSVNMAHQALPCQASLAGHPSESGNVCRTITRLMHNQLRPVCVFTRKEFSLTVCCGRPSMPDCDLLNSDRTNCSQVDFCSSFLCKTVLDTLSTSSHSPQDQPCRIPMIIAPDTRRTFHCEYSTELKVKVKFL